MAKLIVRQWITGNYIVSLTNDKEPVTILTTPNTWKRKSDASRYANKLRKELKSL
jgi:hypothetical protein